MPLVCPDASRRWPINNVGLTAEDEDFIYWTEGVRGYCARLNSDRRVVILAWDLRFVSPNSFDDAIPETH